MAWLPPELELGDEPELKPPELELEFVELDPEFAEPELAEPEPVELEPEEPELVEAPELDEEFDVPVEVDPLDVGFRHFGVRCSCHPSCGPVLENPCTNLLGEL